MPQINFFHSSDITIPSDLLSQIEATIQKHENNSVPCQGRVFCATQHHHPGAMLDIAVLAKPHRDSTWLQQLTEALTQAMQAALPEGTRCGIEIRFLQHYTLLS